MSWEQFSRYENSARAAAGGTSAAGSLLPVNALRRCTRRYWSQRDQFHLP